MKGIISIVIFFSTLSLNAQTAEDFIASITEDSVLVRLTYADYGAAQKQIYAILSDSNWVAVDSTDSSVFWDLKYYQRIQYDDGPQKAMSSYYQSSFGHPGRIELHAAELCAIFKSDTVRPDSNSRDEFWSTRESNIRLYGDSMLVVGWNESSNSPILTLSVNHVFFFERAEQITEMPLVLDVPSEITENSYLQLLGFGNCYFSRMVYRRNGTLKKEVRTNGNGQVMILKHRKNKVKSKVKYDASTIRSATPPCY